MTLFRLRSEKSAGGSLPTVFISYRRKDTSDHARRLHAELARHLGPGNVLMDVYDSRPGTNYRITVREQVLKSDALLVLIGRRWSSSRNRQRLVGSDDLLHEEILIGLESKMRVFPVLVQGAAMPRSTDLPEDLQGLCFLHALEISDERWESDVQRLLSVLGFQARESAENRRDPWLRRAGKSLARKVASYFPR